MQYDWIIHSKPLLVLLCEYTAWTNASFHLTVRYKLQLLCDDCKNYAVFHVQFWVFSLGLRCSRLLRNKESGDLPGPLKKYRYIHDLQIRWLVAELATSNLSSFVTKPLWTMNTEPNCCCHLDLKVLKEELATAHWSPQIYPQCTSANNNKKNAAGLFCCQASFSNSTKCQWFKGCMQTLIFIGHNSVYDKSDLSFVLYPTIPHILHGYV